MLIWYQNINSMSKYNIEIIRTDAELKSKWHFCGLHLHIMGQIVGYILNFKTQHYLFQKK